MLMAVPARAVDGLMLYTRAPGGSRYTGEGELRLAELRADTLGAYLTIDDQVLSAQLSPTCDRIAYVRLRSGKEEIVVCDLDGSNKNVLKDGMTHPSDVRWCAYLCWRLEDKILYSYQKSSKIFTIDPATGEEGVYHTSTYGMSKVSTSLDGKRLTIRARTGYNGVVNIDLTTGEERIIGGGCSNWMSPDGSMFTHCTGGWQNYVIRTWDGSIYKRYTSPEYDKHLAHWSHNSNDWIVFQCGDGTLQPWCHLWIQQVHTGRTVKLTDHRKWNDTGRDFWVGRKELPMAGPVVMSFSANPAVVSSGRETTLSWRVANASGVSIDNGIGSGLALEGSQTVTVDQTTTFTLTAQGDQTTTTATTTVSTAGQGTIAITAPPAGSLTEGREYTFTGLGTNLSWSYDANSDGKGEIDFGTGSSATFTVPMGITDPRQLTVFLNGDEGKVEETYSVVENTVPITLLSPNGGETFAAGDKIEITWNADTSLINEVVVSLSVDGGKSWVLITGDQTVSAYSDQWPTYEWVIPAKITTDNGAVTVNGSSCLLMAASYDGGTDLADQSDGTFTITGNSGVADPGPLVRGSVSQFAVARSRILSLDGRVVSPVVPPIGVVVSRPDGGEKRCPATFLRLR